MAKQNVADILSKVNVGVKCSRGWRLNLDSDPDPEVIFEGLATNVWVRFMLDQTADGNLRAFFFDAYLEAFTRAHRVFFAPVFHAARLSPEERIDVQGLVDQMTAQGTATTASSSIDEMLETIVAETKSGDLIVTMSSGSFENLPNRILEAL